MTLELTIQAMFDEYPTLFQDRVDCLNHLFCVIGNGYKWINGELVDIDDNYSKSELKAFETHLVNGKAFQYNKMSFRDIERQYVKEAILERLTDEQKTPEVLKILDEKIEAGLTKPDNFPIEQSRAERWYFHSAGYCRDYAYLFNYPENIKPDWLAGIEETKKMLREDGYEVD